jgi:DNA mismatch repair ATPase MutL
MSHPIVALTATDADENYSDEASANNSIKDPTAAGGLFGDEAKSHPDGRILSSERNADIRSAVSVSTRSSSTSARHDSSSSRDGIGKEASNWDDDFITPSVSRLLRSGSMRNFSTPSKTKGGAGINQLDTITKMTTSPTSIRVPTAVTLQREMISASNARVIGQVDSKYILVKSGGLLLAVDQHAADERVKLEQLLPAIPAIPAITTTSSGGAMAGTDSIVKPSQTAAAASSCVSSKSMESFTGGAMLPAWSHYKGIVDGAIEANEYVTIGEDDVNTLKRWEKDVFEPWGFRFKISSHNARNSRYFGGDATSGETTRSRDHFATLRLIKAPRIFGEPLTAEDLLEFVRTVTNSLRDPVPVSLCKPPAVGRIAASRACRSAVKFGDALTNYQTREIMSNLSKTQLPFQCAHGRPSIAPLLNLHSCLRGAAGGAGGGVHVVEKSPESLHFKALMGYLKT